MMDRSKKAKKAKLVFKVESPFTSPRWPDVDDQTRDILLQMLCRLFEPIGNHRQTHITPSKGKRSKKRKRKEEQQNAEDPSRPTPMEISPPDPPEISKHITIGLNSTSRRLEDMCKNSMLRSENDTVSEEKQESGSPSFPIALIFLTAPQESLPYAHLPTLCALASEKMQHDDHPILLVPLHRSSDGKTASAPSAEAQLGTVLGIPRVGVVGIATSASQHGAQSLLEYCRENVKPTVVPWLTESKSATWMGTKIGIETGVMDGKGPKGNEKKARNP